MTRNKGERGRGCVLDAPKEDGGKQPNKLEWSSRVLYGWHSRKNKKSVSEGNSNEISHIEADQNILRKHLSENFPAFLHLNSRGREPTVGMQLGLSTDH